jgi:hypothetical protein
MWCDFSFNGEVRQRRMSWKPRSEEWQWWFESLWLGGIGLVINNSEQRHEKWGRQHRRSPKFYLGG